MVWKSPAVPLHVGCHAPATVLHGGDSWLLKPETEVTDLLRTLSLAPNISG
ncbi:MAG: hypothetical protein MUO76_20715 [Anaerolineaceae bacterium]|nr:hypothetical protein [Anaerolineaceae bacterium]